MIPVYYERSDDGIPRDFVRLMKEAIKSVSPQFSTRRMAEEYVQKFYVQALKIT